MMSKFEEWVEKYFLYVLLVSAIASLLFFGYEVRETNDNLIGENKQLNDTIIDFKEQVVNLKEQVEIHEGGSRQFKYLKRCLTNVERMYNDSYHHIFFAEICIREFATISDMRVRNCINFTFINGTEDYFCGFATTTIQTTELVKNNITNVTIYRQIKER